MKPVYDVLIIGAGVIGSAVAREFSRYQLKIGVLEKRIGCMLGNQRQKFGGSAWRFYL